ncbi:DUF2000 family protein [Candidatus Tisiphia endosymbiont of Hybos culiciformis]|uniref:DUF2000 family protein n=1 Tax=Candidatus Tisiphia endosymbiont of Hybos culiciformis TaxID=3139331 RepID=UPI003CCA7735
MSKLNTLFSILNQDIPFGKSLNALGHMSLGMGHRFPEGKMPAVEVYFADGDSIRKVREECQSRLGSVFSDFTNTMTEGTAEEQLKRTSETPVESLQYYGITICTDTDTVEEIKAMLKGNSKILSGYKPFYSTPEQRKFEFIEQYIGQSISSAPHKVSIVASKQLSPAKLVNLVSIAAIEVGRKADTSSLKLLEFNDAGGGKHSGISYHPFTILTAKSQSKLEAMAEKISTKQGVVSMSFKEEEFTVLSCAFSLKELIEDCIDRNSTSLLNKEIAESDFIATEIIRE